MTLFDDRILIEADLVVQSPLLIGAGRDEAHPELMSEEDRNRIFGDREADGPRLALMVRDGSGRPYIPGPTIKGVLRLLCREAGLADKDPDVHALFGEIKDESSGQMGRLFAYGAACTHLPTADFLPRQKEGVFVSARAARDGASGTAADMKLFYHEMVAPGARFRLRLRFLPRGQDDEASRALALLKRLLLTLEKREEGIGFGRGRADGQGRLKLDWGTLEIAREKLGPSGDLKPKTVDRTSFFQGLQALPAKAKRFVLDLEGDGPFYVNNWDGSRERHGEEQPQLKAQRRSDTEPELPGTSLMGALRAEAQWLARLRRMRGHPVAVPAEATQPPEDKKPGDGPEDPVERLFGGETWGALLRLERLNAENANLRKLTSVKLDRFSGAPIDNALFTVEAFVRPCFRAVLSLDPTRARPEDEDFAQELIDRVCEKGLMLGAASNRGFGWFTVKHDGEGGNA